MSEHMVSDGAKLHLESFARYTNFQIGEGWVRAFLFWFCRANPAIALAAIDAYGKTIRHLIRSSFGYATWMNWDSLLLAGAARHLPPWVLSKFPR